MQNLAQEFSNQPSQEEMQNNAKASFDKCETKLVDYYEDAEARREVDSLVRKTSSIQYFDKDKTKIVGVPIAFDVKEFETNSPVEGEKITETTVKVVVAYLAPGYTKAGPGMAVPIEFPGKIKTKTLRASFFDETLEYADKLLSATSKDVLEITYQTLPEKMSVNLGKMVKETPILDFKILEPIKEGVGEIQSNVGQKSAEA